MIRSRDLSSTWALTFVVAALLVARNKLLAAGSDTSTFVQVVNATLIGQALSSYCTLGLPAVAGRASVMSDPHAARVAVSSMERRMLIAHASMMALVISSAVLRGWLPDVVGLGPIEAAVACAALLVGGVEAVSAMHRSLRLREGDSRSTVQGRLLGVVTALVAGVPVMVIAPVAGYALTHVLLAVPLLLRVRRPLAVKQRTAWRLTSADRRLAASSMLLLLVISLPMIALREVLIAATEPAEAAGFLAVISVAATIRSAFLSAFGTVPMLAYDWSVRRFRAFVLGSGASTATSYIVFASMSGVVLPLLFVDDFRFTHATVVLIASAAAFEVYSWCTEARFVRDSQMRLWLGGSILNGLVVTIGLLAAASSLSAQRAALIVLSGWLAQTLFDVIASRDSAGRTGRWPALLAGLAWISSVGPASAALDNGLVVLAAPFTVAAAVVAVVNLRQIGARGDVPS